MRSQALIFAAACAAVTLVVAFFGASGAVRYLEHDTEARISSSLKAAGLDWAEARGDGLLVHLTGTAPSESGRIKALETTARIVDGARIRDTISVVRSDGNEVPDFSLEILRNGEELSLIGLIPGTNARVRILNTLQPLATDETFTDLLETVDYTAPNGWPGSLSVALESAEMLDRSRILAKPGHVRIEAFLDSQEAVDAAETAIKAAAPRGITLDLVLVAPKPIVSPYAFAATRNDAGLVVTSCTAQSQSARQRIETRVQELGADATCIEGLGAPSKDWDTAVIAALNAVGVLDAGRVSISDTDVSFIGQPKTDPTLFDKAARDLRAALPETFSLDIEKPVPPGQETDMSEISPEFVALRDEQGRVAITGTLRDAASRDAVINLAAARFGGENIDEQLTIEPRTPPGWTVRILAAINAMALLERGTLDIDADHISIQGVSTLEDVASAMQLSLAEVAPADTITLDITYEAPPEDLTKAPSARECERQLAEVMLGQQIVFAPSSADISDESEAVLDQIAFIITTCVDARFEIGGHTDSQGRESMNLALSQARADAVLDSLLSRDVLLSKVTAKGYGEATPIADNDTEEGRAANRRIEFKLIVEPVAETTEDTATDGETNEQN